MKAVILNGLDGDFNAVDGPIDVVIKQLEKRNFTTATLDLADMKIGWCQGCFKCWTHTPGQCCVSDDAVEVCRHVIQSDLAVYVTEIVYGGYGKILKKAADRSIPLIMPLLKKIGGETHHPKRYDNYPKLLALGFLPQQDPQQQQLFHNLVHRNSLNMHSAGRAVIAVGHTTSDELGDQIGYALDELGDRP